MADSEIEVVKLRVSDFNKAKTMEGSLMEGKNSVKQGLGEMGS